MTLYLLKLKRARNTQRGGGRSAGLPELGFRRAKSAQKVVDGKGERVLGLLRMEHADSSNGIAILFRAVGDTESATLGFVIDEFDLVLLSGALGSVAAGGIFADPLVIERAK